MRSPSGFALGHASGDGNGWLHWLLWSHGGYLVDKDDKGHYWLKPDFVILERG